jgi:hypothetical protein
LKKLTAWRRETRDVGVAIAPKMESVDSFLLGNVDKEGQLEDDEVARHPAHARAPLAH